MYSVDIRKLASHVYDLVLSLRKASVILNVSHTTVSRWIRFPEKKCYTRDRISKTEQVIGTIKLSLQNDPFLSLRCLRAIVKNAINVEVSKELIRIAIKRVGLSKKKARFFGVPKNLEQKTIAFKESRDRYLQQDSVFVSLDETSFGRNGPEPRGYCPKGKPLAFPKKQPRMTFLSCCIKQKGHQTPRNCRIFQHRQVC